MKGSKKTDEESIEQLFAEVGAYLVEAEDLLLPRLEARVKVLREVCKKAYEVLRRLEQRVIRQELEK